MNSLTVTVCRRPDYTRQTLQALMKCDGIGDWNVSIFVDRQCEQTVGVVLQNRLQSWNVYGSDSPIGCNENVRRAFRHGLSVADYHVHLEDDTVPAKDALSFFSWASRFGSDPGVFCVSGFSRRGGAVDEAIRGHDYTAWGFAIWRDRWQEMEANWSPDTAVSWDTWMEWHVRQGREAIVPVASRIQNIGEFGGTYNNPHVWATEQHTKAMVPDGTSVTEWRLVP